MTNVNVYKLKDIIVLISYVILLALTFVVRIQMQSILTNPTSKVSPDIVHLQASNYTSQPLVAVGDILLPPATSVSSFSSSPVNPQTLTPPILTSSLPVLSPKKKKKKNQKINNSLASPSKMQT